MLLGRRPLRGLLRGPPRLGPLRLGLLCLAVGCGARTGLDVGEAGVAPPVEAEDAGMVVDEACPPAPVPLVRGALDVMLLADRSGSMGATWNGGPPGPGDPSRWEILEASLTEVLPTYEERLRFGAKFFPEDFGLGCRVSSVLDVLPGEGNADAILRFFDLFAPTGSTPAGLAFEVVLTYATAVADNPTVVVFAMDGGPNCAIEPEDGATCRCAGARADCIRDARNCLDGGLLERVREAREEQGISTVVIGIDDPTRPQLTSYLDELALAGGLPRPAGDAVRFYLAREPLDLAAAFERVAEVLSRCLLEVPVPPPEGATVEVTFEGAPLPRDRDRLDGWDWADAARGAMLFFGPSCDALQAGEPDVRAEVTCR